MPLLRRYLCLLMLFLLGLGTLLGPPCVAVPAGADAARRPVALALVEDGTRLLVATREDGSVTLLDTGTGKGVSRAKIKGRPLDLAVTAQGLVAVTTEEGELILLSRERDSLRETRRWKTAASPVSVRLSEDGALASVACMWPRRVQVFDLGAPQGGSADIDLPFAPRRQLHVSNSSRLVVADAFGGSVAVIDLRRRDVESVRSLAVHNLRGMTIDAAGKNLLVTHQILHSRGRPNESDIRSGSLVSNNFRKLALDTVLEPRVDLLRDDRLYTLGDIERGAGDPAEVHETADGLTLITLAGVDELAVGRPEQVLWTRVPVGGRPTALAVDEKRGLAYVANTLSDSISVVDYRVPKLLREMRLAPVRDDLTPEERGEKLFYDARLSLDAWFSCHSCHPDGHTSGRLNDNFSDRSFGTPKRVLSLLGVRDTGPWAWNGLMSELGTQIRSSLTSTMHGSAPSHEQVEDLAAYLRTLSPPPGVIKARGTEDPEAFKRGRRVFAREKCATCHAPPLYTTPKTYDVGLRDEAGEKHFNPPSLRGVSQGGPYFHDNRARRLEDVFRQHRHQLAGELTDQELTDLLHFLGTL